MKKKILNIFIILVIFVFCLNCVFAIEVESVAEELDLDSLINTLNEYTENKLQIDDMKDRIISGQGIDYGIIGAFLLDKLFYEIRIGLKSCIAILIIIVLMAIVKTLELEKDSAISKVTNLVGFLVIVTIIFKSYFVMLKLVCETISLLTNIVEVVAPFMLAILMATGEITTSGIIGPILLFITSLIGVSTSYVIVPLLNVSLVFKIVSNMSDKIKVDKLAKLFSTTAMWIIGIAFALFVGIMELEGSITTSIDDVTVKTTQAAVSNIVPVVGKFVSDSLEVVMGASELIGKAVGVIGIVVMILIALVPVVKILVCCITSFVLAGVSELLNSDEKITNLCLEINGQYKTMLGIMIGVMFTFIVAIGIVIKLMGRVVS